MDAGRQRLRPRGLRGSAAVGVVVLAAALTWPASSSASSTSVAGSTSGAATGSSAAAAAQQSSAALEPPINKAHAIRIARTDPKVVQERRAYGPLTASAQGKPGTWQVDFYADGDRPRAGGRRRRQRPDPRVLDRLPDRVADGARLQRASSATSSTPPTCGYRWRRSSSSGCFDFRRARRVAHLDLLVLLSFGISEIYFNAGNIGVSVPLAYPPLLYLFARMVWIGLPGPGAGLRPSAPVAWLAIGGAFLLGFRIALNIADSGVIDVGYAGVIGADHIAHGQAIWNNFPSDNQFGDTYGPFNYYAYVPFELALPWSGHWDNLPAAHAAAIFFDLATVAGLFALGRRLRRGAEGTNLGVDPGLRVGRLPVHGLCAPVELERHPDRGPARLGPRSVRARRCGERSCSRWPSRPSSRLCLSRRCSRPDTRGLRRGARDEVATAASPDRRRSRSPSSRPSVLMARAAGDRPRAGDVLRPDRQEPARPHLAVQRLGPGSLARVAPDGGQGAHGRAGDRGRVRPTPPFPGSGRRPGRRGDHRGRARGRALVLPLHPLVLRARVSCNRVLDQALQLADGLAELRRQRARPAPGEGRGERTVVPEHLVPPALNRIHSSSPISR